MQISSLSSQSFSQRVGSSEMRFQFKDTNPSISSRSNDLARYRGTGDPSTRNDRTVFINGLCFETTEDTLRSELEDQFGLVKSAEVVTNRYTNVSRGFGYAVFVTADAFSSCCSARHVIIDYLRVEVKKAQPCGAAPPSIRGPPDLYADSYGRRMPAFGRGHWGGRHQLDDSTDGKLFVGGIDHATSEKDLSTYFSKFGPLLSAEIILSHKTNTSRGFGFIIFKRPEDASRCTGRHPYLGRMCEVSPATSRSKVY